MMSDAYSASATSQVPNLRNAYLTASPSNVKTEDDFSAVSEAASVLDSNGLLARRSEQRGTQPAVTLAIDSPVTALVFPGRRVGLRRALDGQLPRPAAARVHAPERDVRRPTGDGLHAGPEQPQHGRRRRHHRRQPDDLGFGMGWEGVHHDFNDGQQVDLFDGFFFGGQQGGAGGAGG